SSERVGSLTLLKRWARKIQGGRYCHNSKKQKQRKSATLQISRPSRIRSPSEGRARSAPKLRHGCDASTRGPDRFPWLARSGRKAAGEGGRVCLSDLSDLIVRRGQQSFWRSCGQMDDSSGIGLVARW